MEKINNFEIKSKFIPSTRSEFPCLELIENLAGSSELCWKFFNAHETVSLKLQGSEFFLFSLGSS